MTDFDWERALHERLVAGDDLALAELYDAHAAVVFGLVMRVTGDRTAAEDITQDIFMRLWERPAAFIPQRGKLRSWLCTAAHRRAIDWLRRARVRQRSVGALARERPPPSDIADAAAMDAMAKAVRAAVRDLPEPQRAAIVLAYYEGLTYRAVADKLGIPEGTAKSRLRLGLRRLGDRLAAEVILDG